MPAGMWEWLKVGMFPRGHSASIRSGFYPGANLPMVLVCKPSIICFFLARPHQQGKREQAFPVSPTADLSLRGQPTVSAA